MARTTWTEEQRTEFRTWHQQRLAELEYPAEVVQELNRARERWMPARTKEEKQPT